jgi:hypothetical protein
MKKVIYNGPDRGVFVVGNFERYMKNYPGAILMSTGNLNGDIPLTMNYYLEKEQIALTYRANDAGLGSANVTAFGPEEAIKKLEEKLCSTSMK